MNNTTSETILQSLRDNVEGCAETQADGSDFKQVYLDNAIPDGMNRHQFAGHLSSLEKQGLYKSQGDGSFGMVRIN